jgi:hypothetical protein
VTSWVQFGDARAEERLVMTQVQRRRLVAGSLVLVVAVAVIIGLVSRGSTPSNDRASVVAWFHASGKQATQSTTQLFDRLLLGLGHSKIDNGGPGILQDKGTCQLGAAGVRVDSKDPPPSTDALRTPYDTMMTAGSSVYSHCLQGIEETSISASKHDVNLMSAEISVYSTTITNYDHALTAEHL